MVTDCMHAVHLDSSSGILLLSLEFTGGASLLTGLTLLWAGTGDDNALHLAASTLLAGLLVGSCDSSLDSVD
jgi:hypothetical protein